MLSRSSSGMFQLSLPRLGDKCTLLLLGFLTLLSYFQLWWAGITYFLVVLPTYSLFPISISLNAEINVVQSNLVPILGNVFWGCPIAKAISSKLLCR